MQNLQLKRTIYGKTGAVNQPGCSLVLHRTYPRFGPLVQGQVAGQTGALACQATPLIGHFQCPIGCRFRVSWITAGRAENPGFVGFQKSDQLT